MVTLAVMKKTILLADDHPLIRVGMRTQLESMGFQRILEAWDQTSVQQTVAANADVALVLLDVVMPGHDGESWPVAFCEQHAHLPVLLVSGLPVNEVRVRFSGCKNVLGLISKARPFADLRRSIDCALDGIPQWPAPESCDQAAATSADRLSQLTPKQAAVARLQAPIGTFSYYL